MSLLMGNSYNLVVSAVGMALAWGFAGYIRDRMSQFGNHPASRM